MHARYPIAQSVTALRATIFIAALLATTLLPMLAAPDKAHAICGTGCTYSDSWGTQEVAGSGWMGGNGVDIYSNGTNAPWGPSPDTLKYVTNIDGVSTQSGIEWQCVELINRLYLTKGWITDRWPGSGYEMYGNTPAGLTAYREAQGSVSYINPGDVIAMSGGSGGFGHVAVVSSVNGSSFTIASQNTNAVYDTSFGLSGGSITYSGWSNYTIQGVIHQPDGTNNSTSDVPVTGDWDGNGTTTVGFVHIHGSSLEWHLRNSNSAGSSDLVFDYGPSTGIPVVGDWDGNGTTTVGFTIVHGSSTEWHLRNSNSAGSSDTAFDYGASSDNGNGITGDWDGDGTDTVGFTRVSGSNLSWHLRNSNSAGSSDLTFNYGASTYIPVVGDWDGNGTTTVGFTNASGSNLSWHIRNSNSAGSSDLTFNYGTSADNGNGITGDWDGNGTTTVGFTTAHGAYRSWHLRNSNSAGSSDLTFDYGPYN